MLRLYWYYLAALLSDQFLQVGFLFIPVKQVHGFEGDDPSILVHDVHAAFLDRPHIKIPGIDEAHDDDAEEMVVAQAGCFDLRQAA